MKFYNMPFIWTQALQWIKKLIINDVNMLNVLRVHVNYWLNVSKSLVLAKMTDFWIQNYISKILNVMPKSFKILLISPFVFICQIPIIQQD